MLLPRQVDFICMHLLEVLELWVSHGTNWASLSGPLDSVPGKIRNQGAPHWTSSHYIYVCLHGYHSQLSSSWHCPWITPRGPTAPNSLFHIQLSLKFANFLKHELSLTLHTQKQELLWAARRQSAILLISIGLLWLGKQTRFLERRKKTYYTSQFQYREPRENRTGPWWWWPHTTPPPFPWQHGWRSAWAAEGEGSSLSGPVGSRGWRAQLQRKHSTMAL